MEDIAIQLVHGRTKHTVQINPMLPLRSLMDKVEELTGIPQSGQKLICQGQTLTSQACVLLIYSCCIFQICSCTVLLLLKMMNTFCFSLILCNLCQIDVEISQATLIPCTKQCDMPAYMCLSATDIHFQ